MVDPDMFRKLYEIPSERILENRRAFYTLWRRCDDGKVRWSKRVENYIRRCEFPTVIMEFLLFDRFVCGLEANKLKSVQSVSKSWTLKQLLEFHADENTGIGHDESVSPVNETLNQNQVKSEPVPNEDESFQLDQYSGSACGGDPFPEIEFKMVIEEEEHTLGDESIANSVEETQMDHDTLENQFDCPTGAKLNDDSNKRNKRQRRKSKSRKKSGGSGGKSFACYLCQKQFPSFYHLKMHLRVHSGVKPFVCDQCNCNASFYSPSNLKTHKLGFHQQVRLHVCLQCNKRFPTTTALKRHSRMHMEQGERPLHTCDECGKSFTEPYNLVRHKSSVHSKIRSFVCEHCGKGFIGATDLKRHLNTHTSVDAKTPPLPHTSCKET